MRYPLLLTKLHIPKARPDRILRPRLVTRLMDGIRRGARVILVSAPAGFGKTTLLADFISQSDMPAAWLDLDEGDNDPVRLWQYLIAAIRTVRPEVGKDVLEALQSGQPPAFEVLITLLINDLHESSGPFLLVLDDFHLIESDAVLEQFNFLLDHLPAWVRVAILTRADPPLHLARRSVHGELVEARASDLRFNLDEIRAFFAVNSSANLAKEDLVTLENRTEGWVAGLQMVALSLRETSDSRAFIQAFQGDDRYVADYLVDEVLEQLPDDLRDFLLKTAVLKRMNAGLCDAVTGRQDSKLLLARLESMNLFVVPLDNRRDWFRFHHLFAQLLAKNLAEHASPAEVENLYRRASQWHLREGNPVEAVEYALACGDVESAVRLMEQILREVFTRGEIVTLARWAQQLPREALARSPYLCVGLAWAASGSGQPKLMADLLRLVEAGVGISIKEFLEMSPSEAAGLEAERLGILIEISVQSARMALDRGNYAVITMQYPRLLPYLVEERDNLPHCFNPPSHLRPPLEFMIAQVEELTGDLAVAAQGFRSAVEMGLKQSNDFIVSLALGHLGVTQLRMGKLNDARATFERAIALSLDRERMPSSYYGLAYAGLGLVDYEQGNLSTARMEFDRGIEVGKIWLNWDALLIGYLGLAQLGFVEAGSVGAAQALEELDRLDQTAPGQFQPFARARRAQYALREGRVEEARAWMQPFEPVGEDLLMPAAIEMILAHISLLEKSGSSLLALERVEQEKQHALLRSYGYAWLRFTVEQVALLDRMGRRAEAVALLNHALEMAAPEGFHQMFLDQGEALAGVLRGVVAGRFAQSAGATSLLAGMSLNAGASGLRIANQGLAEPLSQRELEVLHVLAGGASNAQIAAQFTLSVNTVKKHITNIYGKLGVTTRVQAIEKARKLKLL